MGVSPSPAARLTDIAHRAPVTPFPVNEATVFFHGGADGTGGVYGTCLSQQEPELR